MVSMTSLAPRSWTSAGCPSAPTSRQLSTPCSHSRLVENIDRARPQPTAQADPSRSLSLAFGTALPVQGFGYRPVDDLSASADGRCPKAFREGTRGGRGWRSAIYGDLPGQRLG